MENTKETLGEKIRNYRALKGLSIETLSERSFLSPKTIQRIETNQTKPRGKTLNLIAQALNIPTEALTENRLASEFRPEINQQDWLQKIKNLNLSALLILVLPLANLIFPFIIFLREKDHPEVAKVGGRILSFHILWLIFTSFGLLSAPFLLLFFDSPPVTQFGSIIFTYLLFWIWNMAVTLQIAHKLNQHDTEVLSNWPKIV